MKEPKISITPLPVHSYKCESRTHYKCKSCGDLRKRVYDQRKCFKCGELLIFASAPCTCGLGESR